MIVAEKFKVPERVSPAEFRPRFYSQTCENNWNIKELASAKISKFYHDVNERFLESPFSPSVILSLQREEETQILKLKTNLNKSLAKRRLDTRKLERTEVKF